MNKFSKKSYPQVSIIFPALNGWEETRKCLESINDLEYPKDRLETIVVDNGSADETIKNLKLKIKNYSVKFKIIENKKNLGFAKAINIGAKHAKGEYLLITNNDVTFGNKSISQLVRFLEKNPDVGVAGPYGYTYNFWTGLFQKLPKSKIPRACDWIGGYEMFVRRALWEKLDGFDEKYFFTGEDLDFCLRAKQAGYKIMTCPSVRLIHHEGTTVNKNLEFKYFEGYKSKFRLILAHANFLQKLTAFFLQIVFYTPYRIIVMGEKSFIPMIKALLWNIKNS